MMGIFFLWYGLIVLFFIGVPIFFILKSKPEGPNRFGEVGMPRDLANALSSFFRNYAKFSGRASRSEFWYSMFFVTLISLVLGAVDPTKVIGGIWGLAILVPSFAITARRLHDTNRSGWLQLLSMFFPIGTIALLIWYCQSADGQSAVVNKASSEPTDMVSLDVLERLAKLQASGAITEEEYATEKRKILGS